MNANLEKEGGGKQKKEKNCLCLSVFTPAQTVFAFESDGAKERETITFGSA